MAGIPETIIPVATRPHDFRLAAWFRDAGDDMVLFVHGLGCSKDNFRAAWRRPELHDWTLLAFDLPGFGRTRAPAGFRCRLEDYARLVAAVIDLHASRRVHVVAHSMGGTIALLMPGRALSRIESLVLVEARLQAASSSVAREVSDFDFDGFAADFLPAFKRRTASDPRAAFDAERADPRAFYEASLSMSDWLARGDIPARYQALDCPKAFVYGTDNHHLAELQQVPEAEQIAIEDAAHFVMEDNAEAFYAFLDTWLTRHRRQGHHVAANR